MTAMAPANPVYVLMQPPAGQASRIRFYKRCSRHGCHSKFAVRFTDAGSGLLQNQLGTCAGANAPFIKITELYPAYEKWTQNNASKTFLGWHDDVPYKFTVKLNLINNNLEATCKTWKNHVLRRYTLHTH